MIVSATVRLRGGGFVALEVVVGVVAAAWTDDDAALVGDLIGRMRRFAADVGDGMPLRLEVGPLMPPAAGR